MEKLVTLKDGANNTIYISKSGSFVFFPPDELEHAPGVIAKVTTTVVIYGELYTFIGNLQEITNSFGFTL